MRLKTLSTGLSDSQRMIGQLFLLPLPPSPCKEVKQVGPAAGRLADLGQELSTRVGPSELCLVGRGRIDCTQPEALAGGHVRGAAAVAGPASSRPLIVRCRQIAALLSPPPGRRCHWGWGLWGRAGPGRSGGLGRSGRRHFSRTRLQEGTMQPGGDVAGCRCGGHGRWCSGVPEGQPEQRP